jgi:hypothetical protein
VKPDPRCVLCQLDDALADRQQELAAALVDPEVDVDHEVVEEILDVDLDRRSLRGRRARR